MVPGMRNGARVLVVDPRRTVTVNACEEVAGAENVLHLQITSGTDLALFNTLFTYIADQGWVDADFIAASTFQGDVAVPEDERASRGARVVRGGAGGLQDEPRRRRPRSAA